VTTVDFHFNTPDRLLHACRLIRKAVRSGQVSETKPLLVFCGQPERLARFDDMLYEFSEEDFLPHVMADHPMANESPILLCPEPIVPGAARHAFLLVNLDDEVPDCFSSFDRVFEIVGPEDDDKTQARKRFSFYRDRGYAIQQFDLSKTPR
jgi:DNA polymerase III subunit chi